MQATGAADLAGAGLGRLFDGWSLGISPERWLGGLAVAVGSFALLALARRAVAVRLARVAARTGNDVDDLAADLVARTRAYFLAAVALEVAVHWLLAPRITGADAASDPALTARALEIARTAFVIVALLQGGRWASGLLGWAIGRTVRARPAGEPARAMGAAVLRFLGLVLIWSLVVLLALDNVGVDVTALVTGLGVGGIAVALALQNVLGDLFASIAILLDRPFVIGDFVVVGDVSGTVERIGVKTTHLRTVGGERVVMGNSDLVSSRIRNFRPMESRRVTLTFGVSYRARADELARVPGLLADAVRAQPGAKLERSHLSRFGPSSVDYELVYVLPTPDHDRHMDVQQAVHLAVARALEAAGIELAQPREPVRLEVEGGGPRSERVVPRVAPDADDRDHEQRDAETDRDPADDRHAHPPWAPGAR